MQAPPENFLGKLLRLAAIRLTKNSFDGFHAVLRYWLLGLRLRRNPGCAGLDGGVIRNARRLRDVCFLRCSSKNTVLLGSGKHLSFRLEPDGLVAVGRLSGLDPEVAGALRDLIVAKCSAGVGVGRVGRGRLGFLHDETNFD